MATTSNKKVLFIVFAIMLLVLGVTFVGRVAYRDHKDYIIPTELKIDGTVLDKPRVIGQFQFMSDEGKSFTKDDLKGHWSLLFFGFTNCGYVCPTTLSAVNNMYTALRAQLPANLLPQVILVSVDPDRDTVNRMHQYVKAFNSAFIGIRGDETQTKLLAQQMSVVFAKVQEKNGDYSMNHSAEIMLLDPNGNLRAFLSYPHEGPVMARDYLTIMHALNGKS